MKKLFLFGAALVMAAVSMAQTPTVSTAGIYMRYCTTTNMDVNITIPTSMLPYQYGDNVITEAGDYPTIFLDQRGCDSIITLHVTTFDAKFSVSDSKTVVFSKGLLQYQASTNTWRFAEKQYQFAGTNNSNISSTYDGWIDLFGYSTSGAGAKPYSTVTECSSYYGGDITKTNYDWAWYNPISNGGNVSKMWYTMSQSEWSYLFYSRANSSSLIGGATIEGIKGVVLLPDNWDNSISFNPSTYINFNSNVYTEEQWEAMELKGAVFLVETGSREGTTINNIGCGRYWAGNLASSSYSCSCQPYRIRIGNGESITVNDGYDGYIGYAVRPVREVQ